MTDLDVLPELAAKMVYAIADAMLAEREGKGIMVSEENDV